MGPFINSVTRDAAFFRSKFTPPLRHGRVTLEFFFDLPPPPLPWRFRVTLPQTRVLSFLTLFIDASIHNSSFIHRSCQQLFVILHQDTELWIWAQQKLQIPVLLRKKSPIFLRSRLLRSWYAFHLLWPEIALKSRYSWAGAFGVLCTLMPARVWSKLYLQLQEDSLAKMFER